MSVNDTSALPLEIGRCIAASGNVLIQAPRGAEKPLFSGAPLRAGDKVLTTGASTAELRFSDGTRVFLGASSALVIEDYAFESDDEDDIAHLALEQGAFVLECGDLAVQPDVFTLFIGDTALGLRCARIAVRADPIGYDLVTLLPPLTAPLGEVLAHNKIGMQMLNKAWQTLRLGGADEDMPTPLTLPSGVIAETYAGSGLQMLLTPTEGVAGDDDPDAFQPFQALQDRFLERQFVSRQVFPADGPQRTGEGDRMLEDAFDGTRFRLNDSEPDPAN